MNAVKAIVGVLVVTLVIWGVVAMQDQGPAPIGETVKLGVIIPLSGDASAYGQEVQKVLTHHIDGINAEGGTQFELVYEDGICSGSDAVNAFQKLKDIDGVKIILGGLCSSETLGIAPLTESGDVLAVSGWSSNPTIEGASPYVFTLSYSDQAIGETLAAEMGKFSKVAIITEQNDYNIGLRGVWEETLKNQYPEVEIVSNETFPKGVSDFRNLLAKVQKAEPEAILLNPNAGITAENLLKQLAEIEDWTGYTLFGQISYLADNTRESVGEFANGMVIVDSPDLTDADFLSYKEEIEAAQGEIPTLGNYYTASTIDTLSVIAQLVREVGYDPMAVRDALADGRFKGYLGEIYFGGDSFKQGSQGAVYVVEDGKATPQS